MPQLDLLPSAQPRTVTIDVRGTPRPQGSLKMHPLPGGKIATRYAPEVYAWRAQVTHAVVELAEPQFTGPVEVHLGFDLIRPQGHYGTGRNRQQVKRSSPLWPAVMPDIDKLARAILDSITDAGLWHDDAQVCVLLAAKRYADYDQTTGVHITVTELT